MRTNDLDYTLPPDRIAQIPAPQRDAAKLMVVRLSSSDVEHRTVVDLPELLEPFDLLVVNQTKVMPARFYAVRKSTSGNVEGLFIETHNDLTWHVLLKSGGRLSSGERLVLVDDHEIELVDKRDDGSWIVTKHSKMDTQALLDHVGSMPLPPYIQRMRQSENDLDQLDRQRYQTVYAKHNGAIAAPTAGLHFTDELLNRITDRGIELASLTLHVGMGTFQPIRAATLDEHKMHSEWFSIPAATLCVIGDARRDGRRIIPVGTTSVRALESLPYPLPNSDCNYEANTDLLIQPGFRFRLTDGMMTNFHLPRSTLIALVGALTGIDRLKELYQIAIDHEYRFYSYGDAMLILPD